MNDGTGIDTTNKYQGSRIMRSQESISRYKQEVHPPVRAEDLMCYKRVTHKLAHLPVNVTCSSHLA